MDNSDPKHCSQCYFWGPDSDSEQRLKDRDFKGATGICHRYPPTHPAVPTAANWWCGEWQPRTATRQAREPFLKKRTPY
jgi:hypothetical protein